MDLYGLLKTRYDALFPLDPAQARWAAGLFPAPENGGKEAPRVLDAGCGTGSLAAELARAGFSVMGVDLDEGLLSVAQAKREALGTAARSRLGFARMDIRSVADTFNAGSFDSVLCLGNTLPHLGGKEGILGALAGFRRVLKRSGVLGLQIIDFGRIVRLGLPGLPPLEAEGARFERAYIGIEPDGPFIFRTRLVLPATKGGEAETAEADTRLFALSAGSLDALLGEAGFSHREYSGGFSGESADGTRLPLVAVARP
jgi:glycine/sarcosine N-methyltransferase